MKEYNSLMSKKPSAKLPSVHNDSLKPARGNTAKGIGFWVFVFPKFEKWHKSLKSYPLQKPSNFFNQISRRAALRTYHLG